MELLIYNLLILAHVLLFVYWLGADLGVLHAARYAVDPQIPVEARRAIGEIMSFVDLFPRLSVPLIGAVGVSMATISGDFRISEIWLWLVWFAAVVWVLVNLIIYRNRHRITEMGSWLRFDLIWRSTILLLATAAGAASLAGIGFTDNVSLALKLLIYAAAIALSLLLRTLFRPYRPALARIEAGGDDAENSAIMDRALSRARPVVLAIWFLTVVAAALGLWQPF